MLAGPRSAEGAIAGTENNKVKRLEVLRERCEKYCVWPRKIQIEEVDNDVIEVLCISWDSDASLCFLESEFLDCSVFSAAVRFPIRGKLLLRKKHSNFATRR